MFKFGVIVEQNERNVSLLCVGLNRKEEAVELEIETSLPVEDALYQKDIILLSQEDYDRFCRHEQYNSNGKTWGSFLNSFKQRQKSRQALVKEQPIVAELQQYYPPDLMQQELRRDPRPTLEVALERGVAWSNLFIPNEEEKGLLFKIAEDGTVSASVLGAIYIGCVGYQHPEELPLMARQDVGVEVYSDGNEAFKQVIQTLQTTIRYWRRRDGSFRDRYAAIYSTLYVSGGVRGSAKTRSKSLQKAVYNEGAMPRTLFLDILKEIDKQLAQAEQMRK